MKARVNLEEKPPGTNGLLKLALNTENQRAVEALLHIDSGEEAITRADYTPSDGPLPKNIPTVIILYIAQCCLFNPQSVNFEIDSNLDEIVVTLPNSIQYNLSLILRHADLTQLQLTDDLLQKYMTFLSKEAINTPNYRTINPEGVLCKLHPASISAINIYTTPFYRVINPLCRGQVPEEIKNLASSTRNRLIMEALYVTLFSTHGLSALHELQLNNQHYQSIYSYLHRKIQKKPTIGFFFREQANLSTSIALEGSDHFKYREKKVIVKKNHKYLCISIISQAPYEQEVIFPCGTIFLYSPVSKDNIVFSAREARTPEILDPQGHQALTGDALRYAYINYLNKHYPVQTTLLPRPNHGIVHTIRTLSYVDMVLNYFMHHAKSAYQPYFHHLSILKLCT